MKCLSKCSWLQICGHGAQEVFQHPCNSLHCRAVSVALWTQLDAALLSGRHHHLLLDAHLLQSRYTLSLQVPTLEGAYLAVMRHSTKRYFFYWFRYSKSPCSAFVVFFRLDMGHRFAKKERLSFATGQGQGAVDSGAYRKDEKRWRDKDDLESLLPTRG